MDAAGKVDMMVLCAAIAGKPYTLSPQVSRPIAAHSFQPDIKESVFFTPTLHSSCSEKSTHRVGPVTFSGDASHPISTVSTLCSCFSASFTQGKNVLTSVPEVDCWVSVHCVFCL
jgi:hypothetical protein